MLMYSIWSTCVIHTGSRTRLPVEQCQHQSLLYGDDTFANENNDNPNAKHPKRHVAFLKVHKAASSTAQNIFLRFAVKRNLLVVLPRVPKYFYPNIISTYGTVTSENILPAPTNRSYAILCCHVIYSRQAFARIMPKDTTYIGIVREPFEHFISILNYFRPRQVFNIVDPFPVSKFLQNPNLYNKGAIQSFLDNRIAVEYNFPSHLFETRNKTEIHNYILKLENEFHLIIIAEMFDESIVLMRRLLNWKIEDILYMKQNVRRIESLDFRINPGDVDLYKRWAELDYSLYDHFFKRLQIQIRKQGMDFHEEVLHFKRIRRGMELFCKKLPGQSRADEYRYSVLSSKWNDAFDITRGKCQYMTIHEISFIKEIRLQQYGYFKDTL